MSPRPAAQKAIDLAWALREYLFFHRCLYLSRRGVENVSPRSRGKIGSFGGKMKKKFLHLGSPTTGPCAP